MYLSRIALNVKRRDTMKALASPQLMHGAVENSFVGERQRNLWRTDWLEDTCYLLVLSEGEPDFTNLVKHFGCPNSTKSWETKDYEPLMTRLKIGDSWRFRLRANPIRSSFKEKDEPSGRGKVFAHVTQEQQRQWLFMRAEKCGFKLRENEFDVVHTEWRKFPKNQNGKHHVTLRTATFEGLLVISNLESFKQTLVTGIGRAKAYGCGLLTIAR